MMCLWRGLGLVASQAPAMSWLRPAGLWGWAEVGGHCAHTAPDFLETLTLSLKGFAAKTEMNFDN